MDDNEFIHIRKTLHQHPEVSGDEKTTSFFILNKMAVLLPECNLEKVGDHTLIFTNPAKSQKYHLAFRCELDALPIAESNDFEHRSRVNGVSHKCGHDGHMTIMLRLAHLLNKQPVSNVKVSFIFQSSEENGRGARQICKQAQLFVKDKPHYIFALHNVPGFGLSDVIVRSGVFTPSVISVKTMLFGKTSHAAEPQNGINPAYVISEIIAILKEKQIKARDDDNMLIIAPIEIRVGGDAYGTSAGEGMVGFTFRSWSQTRLDAFKNWYDSLVAQKCNEAGLKCELFWFEAFNSVVNEPLATGIVNKVAQKNGLNVIHKDEPFAWGEDFGLFTELISGTMFGLGAGREHAALHNPDYDFPDELIRTGSDLFYGIIKEFERD